MYLIAHTIFYLISLHVGYMSNLQHRSYCMMSRGPEFYPVFCSSVQANILKCPHPECLAAVVFRKECFVINRSIKMVGIEAVVWKRSETGHLDPSRHATVDDNSRAGN